MEPDDQLRNLLRGWQVENAPASLDKRLPGGREPWWRFLIGGSFRVPVPLALAMAAALVLMGAALLRERTSPPHPQTEPSSINLADFQPAQHPQVHIIGREQ